MSTPTPMIKVALICPSCAMSRPLADKEREELIHLVCELGHAQDQLERIRMLCMGHGVGLRDDVWDVVKRTDGRNEHPPSK
jgi:hypothetical protein